MIVITPSFDGQRITLECDGCRTFLTDEWRRMVTGSTVHMVVTLALQLGWSAVDDQHHCPDCSPLQEVCS